MLPMIRSGLYGLATCPPTNSAGALIVRPAAVVLSGELSGRSFSTNPKRRDEELLNKNYSDAFDESDSLEVGKEESTHLEAKEEQPKNVGRYAGYRGPIFRPLFGGFDDIFARDTFFARDPFAPLFSSRHRDPFEHIMPVLRNFPIDKNKTLLRSSPGYEIKESGGTYEIAVDVPDGVDASDMTVELENDGTLLHLSGKLRTEEEGKVISEMHFDKRFTIGTNVDTDRITANLDNGVLVLKAPKLEPESIGKPTQTIPITKKPHATLDEEVVQTNYSDAFDESDWAETGKVGKEKA